MTQKSKRQLALTDLVNRLSFIQVAKGYNTDAGLHIFLGEVPRFGPNDPPAALAVVVGDDSPETTGGTTRTRVPFEVQAIVPADMTAPTLAIEEIVADIKEAVEIEADGVLANVDGPRVERVVENLLRPYQDYFFESPTFDDRHARRLLNGVVEPRSATALEFLARAARTSLTAGFIPGNALGPQKRDRALDRASDVFP